MGGFIKTLSNLSPLKFIKYTGNPEVITQNPNNINSDMSLVIHNPNQARNNINDTLDFNDEENQDLNDQNIENNQIINDNETKDNNNLLPSNTDDNTQDNMIKNMQEEFNKKK